MKYIFKSLPVLTIFVLMISCKAKKESIQPTIEPITSSVYASGTIKSNDQHELYSKVNGIIQKIFVKEGDLVKKGQAIIQLTNTAPKLNFENAKLLANYSSTYTNKEKLTQATTELELAKLKLDNEASLLERQKKLWSNEIGTRNEIDQRELSYKNALSNYNASLLKLNDLKKQIDFQSKQSEKTAAISSTNLNDYMITSDIEGKVYGLNKLQGEMVTTQQAVAVIGSANQYYIELHVDEYDIAKIKPGQKTLISLDSYKGQVFETVIQKIYPLMDQKSKSFKVDAYFTKQPANLFSNLSAEANIIIETKQKALTIPRNFLIDNEFVYLVNKEKRKVKVGLMDYEKVEILSGISSNDELVKTVQ